MQVGSLESWTLELPGRAWSCLDEPERAWSSRSRLGAAGAGWEQPELAWSSRSWPGAAELELLARADQFGVGAALVAIFYF